MNNKMAPSTPSNKAYADKEIMNNNRLYIEKQMNPSPIVFFFKMVFYYFYFY